jgi:hypothetical protein
MVNSGVVMLKIYTCYVSVNTVSQFWEKCAKARNFYYFPSSLFTNCRVSLYQGAGIARSGNRIPVVSRLLAHVQNGPGAHLSSYTLSTESLSQGLSGQGVRWPPTSIYRRGLGSRPIPLLPLWAFVASSRVTFTFTFFPLYQAILGRRQRLGLRKEY